VYNRAGQKHCGERASERVGKSLSESVSKIKREGRSPSEMTSESEETHKRW
jgi:hypothetical protein